MKIQKSFQLAINILVHSKLRSWLTIIGIVIGVAAIVAIISIGEGAQVSLQSRLGGLGADLVTVSPGFQRAGGAFGGGRGGGGFGGESSTIAPNNLTLTDIQVIKNVPGVLFVDGIISGRATVTYLAESASLNLEGVDPLAWTNMETSTIAAGRFLDSSDEGVVVIGSSVAATTFKEQLSVNQGLTINGTVYKIVGILAASGGFGGDDNRIFMTVKDARQVLNREGENSLDSIQFKVADSSQAVAIANETDQRLQISRHVIGKKKDYTVTSAEATQASIASVTQTFTLFLAAIAAVSLLVGAVGIANTMFTSVLEKTKEIGIMKAIGAKNRDIMTIFLLNSALVGFVGGVVGIGLGALVSALLPNILGRLGGLGAVNTVIPPSLLLEAVLGSMLIGMIAGAIPAYRASKLKPVDALRYE
jgi:putative ABC transport system permease protein